MSDIPPPPAGGDPGQPWQPQQPPTQPPYGAPQYVPSYGGGYGPSAPDHPQATTVLILGILGLVVCGAIAPFAWVMGNRVVGEIDASNGAMGGRGNAQAGRICGMIGTILLGLGVLLLLGFVVIGLGMASTSSS